MRVNTIWWGLILALVLSTGVPAATGPADPPADALQRVYFQLNHRESGRGRADTYSVTISRLGEHQAYGHFDFPFRDLALPVEIPAEDYRELVACCERLLAGLDLQELPAGSTGPHFAADDLILETRTGRITLTLDRLDDAQIRELVRIGEILDVATALEAAAAHGTGRVPADGDAADTDRSVDPALAVIDAGPVEVAAATIDHSVRGITTAPPASTLSGHGRAYDEAMLTAVRERDGEFLCQGSYQLYRVANRGRTAVDWTGFARGEAQVLLSWWNGRRFASHSILDACENTTYRLELERPATEEHLWVLVTSPAGPLFTDSIEARLRVD